MGRDARLDVWRGICLVDVVLVHLAFNGIGFPQSIDAAIRDYTRFAAGGFVLLAGLTVAAVFGPAVERSEAARRDVYRRLWRRAAWLVLATLAIECAYRLVDLLRFFPLAPDAPLSDALSAVLLFRVPGALGGILLLYTFLLAATPLLFEVRRRLGDAPIVLASVLLYASALGLGDTLVWPRNSFPVAHWQTLFVAGFVLARTLPTITRSTPRLIVWAVASSALWLALVAVQYGPGLGLSWPPSIVALDFTKTPLHGGALLWYLATVNVMLALTSLAWHRIHGSRAAGAFALLGRNSLLVYSAHVFTEIPALEVAWAWAPPAPWVIALAAADLAALAALCLVAERWGTGWARRLADARPHLTHATAGAVIAVAITASALAPSGDHAGHLGLAPEAHVGQPGLLEEVALSDPSVAAAPLADHGADADFSPVDLLELELEPAAPADEGPSDVAPGPV